MAAETATAVIADATAVRDEAAEAIRIERLTRRYGEREALANVSAVIARGQTLAVLGRNGAGKTTLLRVLATLLLPHAGLVRVLGLDLPREAHALRARIGMLEATGMERRAEEPVSNLSRGMAQRVAVCRAVLHRPELLLLDEPHAHLDPEAAALVDPLIGRASGTTRVLVSHDVELAVTEADRILGLRDGRLVADVPAGEVTPQVVQAVYGGAR